MDMIYIAVLLVLSVPFRGYDSVASASSSMFLYESESEPIVTTTSSPTTTTELSTYPPPPVPESHEGSDEEGSEVDIHNDKGKIHGSDEIKVFFSDCNPYRRDCLFGGPVCASDKKTYPNFMFMECLNFRRQPKDRVKVVHEGLCWSNPGPGHCALDPVYNPVCGNDNKTYVNILALQCVAKNENPSLQVFYPGECLDKGYCYFTNYTWDKPVCISNGRTLQSYRAVKCLQSVDSSVEIIHDGPCTGKDLQCVLKNRTHICHRLRNEIEPFPVCGTDGFTYPNAAYVLCLRPHLEIDFDSTCNSTEHKACFEAQKLDKDGKGKPVCGSDGKNYNSIHHLNCAKIIKTYLKLLHNGPCQALDSPCVQLYNDNNIEDPVCASDGVTYTSPTAMECVAKYKRNGVEFRHMKPCLKKY